ncbi:MAG TPA: hypothetical protein VLZ83_02190 [Edaphocola sp.]|nr:hypothetical protein [Edaphocola sp.]
MEFASDPEGQKAIINDRPKLFENLHGYKVQFFVPPNGLINNELEQVAAASGVHYMSSPKIQQEVLGEGRTKKTF